MGSDGTREQRRRCDPSIKRTTVGEDVPGWKREAELVSEVIFLLSGLSLYFREKVTL